MLIPGAFGANKYVPPIDQKQLTFRDLPSDVHLIPSQVTAIAQDGAGFIWFGTPSGLNRFDGYTIQKFFKGDVAESIPHDFVRSLLADSSGALWIVRLDFSFVDDSEHLRYIDPGSSLIRMMLL